jgi:hypothetical protein
MDTTLSPEEEAQLAVYMASRKLEPGRVPVPAMTSERSLDLFFRLGKGEIGFNDPDLLEAVAIWQINALRWETIYDEFPVTRDPANGSALACVEMDRRMQRGRCSDPEAADHPRQSLGDVLAAADLAIAASKSARQS